jgi:uncharacterized Zn finger protein (UPF0148 family)
LFRKPPEDQDIKRMADLLCQGSTLTDLACPACSSPLFKLKNEELWCGKCEKKVVVVKEGEDPSRILSSMALANLEATLLAKIQDLQDKMQHEESVEKLLQLNTALSGLLDNLGKLRKTKGK